MSEDNIESWSGLKDLQSPSLVRLQNESNLNLMSPVSGLVVNFGETSLGSTPRRKVPFSNGGDAQNGANFDGDQISAAFSSYRLLKNSIKMTPSGATNQNRVRAFAKRPLSQNLFFGDKENCKKSSTTTEETQQPAFPSPSKQISPSKYAVARNRHPLEDHDPNSQDSGYGAVNLDKDDQKHSFRFTEPLGIAPRRSIVEQSPRKDHFSSPRKFIGNPAIFRSLSSSSGSESLDDGFMEIFESEKMDEDAQLPSGLNSLLSGTIRVHGKISPLKENSINSPLKLSNKNENIKSPEQRKIIIGRSLSFSGSRKQVRSCLFSSDNDDVQKEVMSPGLDAIRSFKRPEPPCGFISPLETKRRKSNSLHCITENQIISGGSVQGTLLSYGFERQTVKLQRSFSETEATIKSALQKASQQPDLIGDFSRPFILPLMCGRHEDLKAISPDTLASLLNGNYSDSIDSFTIIDCRYPYEFEGGHIRGAKNVYTKDQIWKEFVENKNVVITTKDQNTKRNILIFHCEFSSERGPCLSRFLRNCDRTQNKECYPSLSYPEVYLLDGGYKNFFEKHSEMCEPRSYQPMHDPKFESDLRKFRAKSKSWNGDNKTRLAYRSNLKRLGL